MGTTGKALSANDRAASNNAVKAGSLNSFLLNSGLNGDISPWMYAQEHGYEKRSALGDTSKNMTEANMARWGRSSDDAAREHTGAIGRGNQVLKGTVGMAPGGVDSAGEAGQWMDGAAGAGAQAYLERMQATIARRSQN